MVNKNIENEYAKLLKNADILQNLAKKSFAFQFQVVIKTLRLFKKLINPCFGQTLDTDSLE